MSWPEGMPMASIAAIEIQAAIAMRMKPIPAARKAPFRRRRSGMTSAPTLCRNDLGR